MKEYLEEAGQVTARGMILALKLFNQIWYASDNDAVKDLAYTGIKELIRTSQDLGEVAAKEINRIEERL